MEFPFSKKIKTESETIEIAKEFSKLLVPGEIVLLNGDLGSGKTFFVKNVCRQFGIENVSSPSFSIVNEYHNGKDIIHFDFYRVKKIEELYDIGFEDYIMNNETIVFIEWADMFTEILPKKNYEIELKIDNNTEREISILKHE
ncbi:MAG: tRNA (adenosine(37)-N6)-threonylcarbamoyltransferase complex ATPase subunit type 1 TsaE [Ignavibacteriales bacterium]|nr:tRNA (adenosine(37)-N6)-threonylcarbamoyltransferase complex ATPase subunit type 1 TsaE [Ignavibacteriales bacterium]